MNWSSFLKYNLSTVKGRISISIDDAIEIYENMKDDRKIEFLNCLKEYISTLDENLDDYSPSKMKILMELNGFDIDECHSLLMKFKLLCVDNRIGIIDIKKPIDMNNICVSLLEF